MSGPTRAPLEAALEYRARGWSPLPIQDDKQPHFAALEAATGSNKWGRLKSYVASDHEIREWFTHYPDAGVGIVTGPVSGGLVVVDFDEDVPPGIRLPVTPIVKATRGLHIYLASDGNLKSAKFANGELIADGGYAVAPPPSSTASRVPG